MKRLWLLIMTVVCLEASSIKDYSTGLEWQDNYDAKTVERTWEGAKRYCQDLVLEGKSDWRLPSVQELQTIVDIQRYNPAIKNKFNYVASKDYWSSTPAVSDAKYAWAVYFFNGHTDNHSKSSEYYVRCVRGRQ